MSAEEIRALWARHLGGEELSAAEQAGLVAALEADPELRADLLEDVQLDGSLRALGDARRDEAAFVAQVAGCLAPERDATRFIRKVEARLAEPPPEPVGSRDSRTGLPRLSRRFLRRSDPAGAGWKAALAAAAALFAILLFSAALSGKPRDLGRLPKKAATAPREAFRSDELVETPPVLPPKERIVVPAPKPALPPGPEYRTPEPLVVPAPRPSDAGAAKPEPPPAAVPAPAPTRAAAEAAIARGPKVVSVIDQVYFVRDQTRVPAGAVLEYGQDLYTRGRGRAVLKYDDGTTVDVASEAMLRELSDERGRRLLVSVGTVEADIRKQPEGRPMIFVTPHAEAAILGTKIRLATSADPRLGSTLEVLEGKVRFSRLSDGSSAEVAAGRSATASTTQDVKARVAFPDHFTIRFGPADLPRSSSTYVDSGDPYSAAIGFGWDPIKDGQLVPGGTQPDGSPVRTGRVAVRKAGPLPPNDLKATSIAAGWGEHAETWEIDLPNGGYLVSVCVGDPTFEQGPHYVSVQGLPLLNGQVTQTTGTSKWFFLSKEALVEVKDGKLKMKVGGGSGKSPADGSRDTILNYLVIKRVTAK